MARSHRGNPVAVLRLEQVYGIPVLLSGIGTLVLNQSELSIIDKHHRNVLRCILRFPDRTPAPVFYFLSGSLPASALIHIRQLTLLGMIARQRGVLYNNGLNVYINSKPSARSWFLQVAGLCLKYDLPHPIILLQSPLDKNKYKSLIKARTIDFWERKLRYDASLLSSLKYFKYDFYSLKHPHIIFQTAGSNPYKVQMSILQSKMLGNLYMTESKCRFWSVTNPSGFCSLPSCVNLQIKGDLEHFLSSCESLIVTREDMINYMFSYSLNYPEIIKILKAYAHPKCNDFVNFVLDCSSLPLVIQTYQRQGKYILDMLFK